MSLEVHKEGETLLCCGSLDIGNTADFGRAIADHLRQHAQTTVDLSGINGCDAAGLQVLYAAKKQAQKSGKRFAVRAVAREVQDKAAHLGLCLDEC